MKINPSTDVSLYQLNGNIYNIYILFMEKTRVKLEFWNDPYEKYFYEYWWTSCIAYYGMYSIWLKNVTGIPYFFNVELRQQQTTNQHRTRVYFKLVTVDDLANIVVFNYNPQNDKNEFSLI